MTPIKNRTSRPNPISEEEQQQWTPVPRTGLDSRPEQIKRVADESLKRLRVDVIDLFYQHRPEPNIPIEEVARSGNPRNLRGDQSQLGGGLCFQDWHGA